MPFNGSGVFVRNYSWTNDATNSIPITATRMDADTNDIVNNGLGLCLTRDGQAQPTANLPMAGFKHTGAAPGVAASDYATMAQITGLAPLASPAFSGTPTAPTASAGTNSTQIATTAFVGTALSAYLPLSGGTVANLTVIGNATIQGITGVNNLALSPSGGGSTLYSDGGSNYNMVFRTGPSPYKFCVIDQAGNFIAAGSVQGANLVGSGSVILGGVIQPTIFVQSGTPTARNTGDLWFF